MNTDTRSLRNTHQRRLVLELVRQNPDHPTADDVYELARERDPNISKGTVYRNLNLLYELGEIKKLPMPFGPDHYDFNTDNHYHFICRCCYKVVDADVPYMEEINKGSAGGEGFVTEWHRLILVGLCPECQKKINEQ